jgi:hypothetical protein
MLMLAPFNYEETPEISQERLDGYKYRLARALQVHQGADVRGSFIREGRFAGTFAFTGDALGQFRNMAQVIRTAFPEVRLMPDTSVHFIRLTQYIQYRQQQRLEESRKELATRIAEVNRDMPDDRQLVMQENQIDLVNLQNNAVIRQEQPANEDNMVALFDLAHQLDVEDNPRIDLNEETLEALDSLYVGGRQMVNPWVNRSFQVKANAYEEILYEKQEDLVKLVDQHLDDQSNDQVEVLLRQAKALSGVTNSQIRLFNVDWSEYVALLNQESQKRQADQAEQERQAQEQASDDGQTDPSQESLLGGEDQTAPEIPGSGSGGAAFSTKGSPDVSLEDLKEKRDAMEDQVDRQGKFVDTQLVDRLKRLEETIAELEGSLLGGGSGWGNGQDNDRDNDKWQLIGENADGVPVLEDGRGVRALEEAPGIRVTESVGLAFTRNGIEAHRADRKDIYRTADEMAQRGPVEITEGQLIRMAFQDKEADLGEATGVVVEFNGDSRSFLVTQKHPTPRDGHSLPTLNVRRLRASADTPDRVVDDFLVTPRNTLERQGLAKNSTPALEVKWQQAGLSLPALKVTEATSDEMESPYHRELTPLTRLDYQLFDSANTNAIQANQSALEKARSEEDSSPIDALIRERETLDWEANDLRAGYMMTVLHQSDRQPNEWPTNKDILALAEHYPSLAQRFSEVTGNPVMPGPWPRSLADLQEIRDRLKVGIDNDPENQILSDRMLDV